MRKYVLASACALALASPAFAQTGISFDALGTYGNIAGFPSWSAGGEVNVPLDLDGLSVDGTVGDTGVGPLHIFNGGGSLMWSDGDFRLAGAVDYNRISKTKAINESQIGAAGQWFATPWLTATVGGGGIVGDNGGGGYVSGNLKGYVCPDVALDGFASYENISDARLTDFGVHAEYLPFEQVPVSIGATYDHIYGSGDHRRSEGTDSWWVGLKLYLNDSPASSLEDRQRTGTLDTMQPSLHFAF